MRLTRQAPMHESPDHGSAAQLDDEDAALWMAVLDADHPSLRFDRKTTEHETEPGGFVAGHTSQPRSAEGLEHPGTTLRRHTGPLVVNGDADSVGEARHDHTHPALDPRVLHGVAHQILEDTSHELGVAVTRRFADGL